MARSKSSEGEQRRRKPATSPEAREQQLASLAYDVAEEQLASGTASSQVVPHFLKAGSSREKMEQMRMEHEIEMMKVKREAIRNQERADEMFSEALKAMRSYQGADSTSVEDDIAD